jgi:hypothetical protein
MEILLEVNVNTVADAIASATVFTLISNRIFQPFSCVAGVCRYYATTQVIEIFIFYYRRLNGL